MILTEARNEDNDIRRDEENLYDTVCVAEFVNGLCAMIT